MLRLSAHVFSILFHPLFIMTYMLLLLLFINPYIFGVNGIGDGKSIFYLMHVFISTVLIPGLAVLIMKLLGLVSSIRLDEKEERIGPYIATGIFYLWLTVNFINSSDIPLAYTAAMLGATIALFTAFIFNIFTKVSLHAVGMGGMIGMLIVSMLLFSYGSFSIELPFLGQHDIRLRTILLITIILSGIVGTARLILRAHDLSQIYQGFMIGFATQFIALQILN